MTMTTLIGLQPRKSDEGNTRAKTRDRHLHLARTIAVLPTDN